MKDPLSPQASELFAREYDFALGFSRRLSTNQLNAISFLFDQKGFKHLVVNDPKISKYSLIFLHYDNPEQFLKEAEKHGFLKQKYERTQSLERRKSKVSKLKEILVQKGAESLDPRVKQLETMGRFTFKERDLFLKETISFKDGRNGSAVKQNKQQNKENEEPNELESLLARAFSSQDIDLEILKERYTGRSNTQLKIAKRKNSSIQTTEHDSEQRLFSKSSKRDYYNEYMSIFTPSEICQVVRSLLSSIEINTYDPSILEIFKINEKVRASFPNKRLIEILTYLKLLAFIRPLHTRELKTSPADTDSLRDYFGPKVSMYFEYLVFYIKWLTVPAICGVLNQYTLLDNKPGIKFWLDTIYCLVIMIWSAMFVRFWERKTNEIKVKSGTYGHNFKISNTRKDFKGKARVNPITELPELYVNPTTKLKKYIVSLLIHLPLFFLSLFVALLYLNVKGYSIPGHWIYFPEVARLAEPGQIFGKGSHLKIIPWVGRLLLKFIFKHMNNLLSDKTTAWENHRTHTGYNNSLITKRFLFGMVNTFTNLTYLAFWKVDLDALREELLTLYISDELKRLFVYSLLPYLRQKIFAKKIEKSAVISKRGLSEHRRTQYIMLGDKEKLAAAERSLDLYIVKKVNEIGGKEYDMIKDYYEMVMQFGYITLFAVAFPLSGIISLLLNLIELRSDFFKLTNVIRRPMPESVDGIGAWLGAIKTMTYLSVITNSILIANAAEFRTAMAQEIMEHPQIEGQEGKMLGIVFMVEHIMLVIIFLLRKLIEKQPTWVSVYVKRNLEKGSGLWAKIY